MKLISGLGSMRSPHQKKLGNISADDPKRPGVGAERDHSAQPTLAPPQEGWRQRECPAGRGARDCQRAEDMTCSMEQVLRPSSNRDTRQRLDNSNMLILIWPEIREKPKWFFTSTTSNPSLQVIFTTSLNTYFAFSGSQKELAVTSFGQGFA